MSSSTEACPARPGPTGTARTPDPGADLVAAIVALLEALDRIDAAPRGGGAAGALACWGDDQALYAEVALPAGAGPRAADLSIDRGRAFLRLAR